MATEAQEARVSLACTHIHTTECSVSSCPLVHCEMVWGLHLEQKHLRTLKRERGGAQGRVYNKAELLGAERKTD